MLSKHKPEDAPQADLILVNYEPSGYGDYIKLSNLVRDFTPTPNLKCVWPAVFKRLVKVLIFKEKGEVSCVKDCLHQKLTLDILVHYGKHPRLEFVRSSDVFGTLGAALEKFEEDNHLAKFIATLLAILHGAIEANFCANFKAIYDFATLFLTYNISYRNERPYGFTSWDETDRS